MIVYKPFNKNRVSFTNQLKFFFRQEKEKLMNYRNISENELNVCGIMT
jgi:hypothetical protein